VNWTQARSVALGVLGGAYQQRIERLAEEVRPRFESGEFRGFIGEDLERELQERTLNPHRWIAPRWRFADVVESKVEGDADAYLILACSPSGDLVDGDYQLKAARTAAAECMSLDVFRIGLHEGWYKPGRGEEPSAEALLGQFAPERVDHLRTRRC
jgi:hypothetical protein